MKILVAEDDLITRRILEAHLVKWGYAVVMVADGQEAWRLLQQDDAPSLAILDWMMPGMDGTTICREVRKLNRQPYIYLILLTARGYKEHLIEGLRGRRGRISHQAFRSLRTEGAASCRSADR